MSTAVPILRPEVKTAPLENLSPGTLTRPAFVMNAPFSFSTDCANNPWMTELRPEARDVDHRRAMVQFLQLYRFITAEALVWLVPASWECQLQDLVFTANLGVVFEHLPGKDTVVVSNFTTAPRRGETAVGQAFFRAMGYTPRVSPHKFEGDAELKHLHDNVYIGGYGIRSESETYDWMEETFDMEVIKVRLQDPYLYHLDCTVFPITREDTLVCTGLLTGPEVAAIERHTNIVDVSEDDCYAGICNSVRLYNTLLNASHVQELKAGTEAYQHEVAKNRSLEDIAARLALEVSFFNLSEYHKGGALLSCMLMHLNRNSYEVSLL